MNKGVTKPRHTILMGNIKQSSSAIHDNEGVNMKTEPHDVDSRYNGVEFDNYGQPERSPDDIYHNDEFNYNGWKFSPRSMCIGFSYLIGLALLVLGAAGFGIALYNSGAISTLMTNVMTLMSDSQATKNVLDRLTVPFDHTSAGPLQAGVSIQYISAPASAAMTMLGDLSSYINNQICVVSKTAFPHTITIGAGGTWDGVNSIATFGGVIGDGLCFLVFSSTQVHITSSPIGITFS